MIRAATEADAPWIAEIWNAIIADTLITFTTDPKSVDAVRQMIAERPVLVLPDSGGFATYGPFRGGPGYAATIEHTVLLAPKTRGQGQGRALMAALIKTAQEAGHHVMVAGISGANPGAIAFHAALGFEQVAHMPEVGRKSGQWLDLVLMQKTLGSLASATTSPPDPL
ncbi:MAG: N-acetyltransferase family protein [Pseudomonadota bacterium]